MNSVEQSDLSSPIRPAYDASADPLQHRGLNLPDELKKYSLNFLSAKDLLNGVRGVSRFWKKFSEQTINEQKRSLLILNNPKIDYNQPSHLRYRTNTNETIPPSIEESLGNTFSCFKISFAIDNRDQDIPAIWERVLRFLNMPNKDLQLKIYKDDEEPTAYQECLVDKYRDYFRQLNNQPNLKALSTFYPPIIPLNIPSLSSLELEIRDFSDLTAAFNPLPNLETLRLKISDNRHLDLATMPELPQNLRELDLDCGYGFAYAYISDLQNLNNLTQLRTLIISRSTISDVNLSFRNLPLTKLHLKNNLGPKLKTLELPSTLTELGLLYLDKDHKERLMCNLWENLATMCPSITSIFLTDTRDLRYLSQEKLVSLTNLRSIKLGFTSRETEESVTSLKEQWPDLKMHEIRDAAGKYVYIQVETSTSLKIIF